jgi:hypothetical protein
VPGTAISRNQLKVFSSDRLEIDKEKIKGAFNFAGTFSFSVTRNGNQIATGSVDINTLIGNLEAGTLKTMENQISVVTNDIIVCCGFYDAGLGAAGLPSSDQCYAIVTPNCSNWMGEVAPPGSAQALKPFSRLFLPAAHDIGMNSTRRVQMLCSPATLSSTSWLLSTLSSPKWLA